ncbi:hypothetical protein CRUP_037906 [Coryphaenoides rupestris]|nr:hypothetical protein CRUP_037906 [Coryphaenoides rupestris]
MERETERKKEEEEEEEEGDVKDTGVLGHEEDEEDDDGEEEDDDDEKEEGVAVTDKGVLGHEEDEEDEEDDDGEEEDDDGEEEEGDAVTDKGVLGHEDEEEDDDDDEMRRREEGDGVTDKGVLGHEEEEKGDDEGGSNRTVCVEEDEKDPVKKKKALPGIIYLGHIPPRLRPKHMRNMLTPYGEIGRIFLQPEDRAVRQKRKKAKSRGSNFTEGWVEFSDKRIAKRVAAALHNTPMGNKKHHRFHADLWSIKRLRTEVSQAKRETNFFLGNVDKSQSMAKRRKKMEKQGDTVEERSWDFTQRLTEEEIQQEKKKRRSQQDKTRLIQEKSQSNVSLLAKIFNAGGQKQN